MLKMIGLTALVALIAAIGCYAASAQRVYPGADHNETLTLTVGQLYEGALDYSDWCDHTQGMTSRGTHPILTGGPESFRFETGLHWEPQHRVDTDTTKAIYGIPVRHYGPRDIVVSYRCIASERVHVEHRTTVSVSVTGDLSGIPANVQNYRVDDAYWRDPRHPTHAAEIDSLETRVAEVEGTAESQGTAIAVRDVAATALVRQHGTTVAEIRADATAISADVGRRHAGVNRRFDIEINRVNALETAVAEHSHD